VIVPGADTSALAGILQPDERVIWTGRPDPAATFRTQLFWWWLGMPVLGITVGLRYAGIISPDISYIALVIAFTFLVAPAVMVAVAYGTTYAITDRRVIIKYDTVRTRQRLVWYSLETLDKEFEILNSGENVGHLYFMSGARSEVPDADYTGKVAFREVRNPREVASLLESARKHLQTRPPS
jgi:hypothetical protein